MKKIGHKSSHCRNKNQTKSRVRLTKAVDIQEESLRKYVTVKILGKDIKFQLDSGSDLIILKFNTWKKLEKPTMLRSHKTAKVVNGTQISFEGEVIINVTLLGKTKKLKMYVLKNTENLFGSDWMHEFNGTCLYRKKQNRVHQQQKI